MPVNFTFNSLDNPGFMDSKVHNWGKTSTSKYFMFNKRLSI